MFTPFAKEARSSLWLAPSFVLTMNIPISERMIPIAAINIGVITNLNCISIRSDLCAPMKIAAPRDAVARMDPQYDS